MRMESGRPVNGERLRGGRESRRGWWWAALAAGVLLLVNLGPSGCGCDLEITTTSLPDAIVNKSYGIELDSHCGGDTWFLSHGGLPPGIALQSDGDLGGTPTVAGVFTFTVGVFDFDSGDEAFKGFTLTVLPAAPPT